MNPRGSPDVLFLGHGAERSGPPIFLMTFQTWLDRNGPWRFATVLGRGGDLLPQMEELGPVRVVDDGWTPARIVQQGLRRLDRRRMAAGLARRRDRRTAGALRRAPVLYVNTIAPETLRLYASLVREGQCVIVHVHEMEATLRYRADPLVLSLLLRRADGIVSASQAVADNLVANHGVDPHRLAVHHELVRPVAAVPAVERASRRRALGLDPDAFVVIGSGRFEWRKAPELFVTLGARLVGRLDSSVAFVWVGGDLDGEAFSSIDHELRHLGVESLVRFIGEVERPGDWFALADVFAQVAREDAYPIACLEAASAGVPIVTFDTGGMVEFVASGGGEVVPYPNVDAFAQVLADLAADPERRADLGSKAAIAAATHTAEHAAAALVAQVEAWC